MPSSEPEPVGPTPRFQNFEEHSDPRKVAPRLKALRAALAEAGLDGFLVPRADVHRGESVPPGEARLGYVTGFTGSAGLAVIGLRRAALLVDSRYTLQAPAQTDTRHIAVHEAPPAQTHEVVLRVVGRGKRLGYDPWLHTPGEIESLKVKLNGAIELVPSDNPVDRIWADRPGPPHSEVEVLGHNRAGRTAEDKLSELRGTLAVEGADSLVLTLPESICWLFNIRGHDVPNTPVVLGFAVVPRRGRPTLFLDAAKITPEVKSGFGALASLKPKSAFPSALQQLAADGKTVWIDPSSVPEAVAFLLQARGAKLLEKRDPVLLPKSRKNEAELAGMREAHRLDGIAMAKFLHWFDARASQGGLAEIDVVTTLEAFRREDPSVVDASFDTIAGAGPNGAIVHYRVTEKTNRMLQPGELMLVDSGAQYVSGTTDITRTIATGAPTPEQKDRFTRVLKGMISISTARFPRGTTGAQIDVLARQHLWQAGVTYNHGTGHGVGAYLGVHEGPVGISPRYSVPFEPGMIVSNEPGFYKTGEYGIRVENLIVAKESELEGFMEWETLTLAPIDRRLVEPGLLTEGERAWLDAYHARVFQEIGPTLSPDVKAWLKGATAPI